MLVTDQNLPDFVVRNIHPSEASIIAGETIEVEFDIANIGFRNRAGSVPYAVYWVDGTNTWRYAAEIASSPASPKGASRRTVRSS